MSLGEEDLSVLMKILVENIGEGSSQHCIPVNKRMVQGRWMLLLTDVWARLKQLSQQNLL